MHVGLTGGTGFIGRHLSRRLRDDGHAISILARGESEVPEWMVDDETISVFSGSVAEPTAVERALAGADAVGHLAGINHERGKQTYRAIHERGTANVLRAAEERGVERVVLMSYLRARPSTGSGYHASKWRAERLCRAAGVPTAILKPAGVFGPGDQLLTNLVRWVRTVPILPLPAGAPPVRPVAVEDVVRIALAGLAGRIDDRTVSVLGPETLTLAELTERVATSLARRVYMVPTPPTLLGIGGQLQERILERPIVTRASATMLAEGMVDAAPAEVCEPLPKALTPNVVPSKQYIREHIDATARLGIDDLAVP